MPISRLRLRMAAGFAGAVAIAVLAGDVALAIYLRRDADARLTRDLQNAAIDFLEAIRREAAEPAITPAQAVHDAVEEWPAGPTALAAFTFAGSPLGVGGPTGLRTRLRLPSRPTGGLVRDVPLDDEGNLRMILATDARVPRLWIVAGRSTADLREYGELLTDWLVLSVPAIALFSLLAGYWLAGRALRPMRVLADTVAHLAPDDLRERLPVRTPPDEIDRLADRFNGLLARLADARDRNRSFLAQAAHQIKTPLTVVRGESALGLERPRDNETYRAILERVRRAADQMSGRVDDLMLLAHAEAGERPPLADTIELDGLALECADLMRGRAQQARRSLELDRVLPGVARGNEPLLRDALLELIENAVKHGAPERPIQVSAYCAAGQAHLAVASAGPALPDAVLRTRPRDGSGGLGLSILAWIAQVHGGTLSHRATDHGNTFELVWPTGEAETVAS